MVKGRYDFCSKIKIAEKLLHLPYKLYASMALRFSHSFIYPINCYLIVDACY